MVFIDGNHKRAYRHLVKETNYGEILTDIFDVPEGTILAVFYLLTSPKVLEHKGYIESPFDMALYVQEDELKLMKAEVPTDVQIYYEVALDYLNSVNVDFKKLFDGWLALSDEDTKQVLIQSLFIFCNLEPNVYVTKLSPKGEDPMNIRKYLARKAMEFLNEIHEENYRQLVFNCEALIEFDDVDYVDDQFDPVLYILAIPRVKKAIDFLGNEREIIAFYEQKQWVSLAGAVPNSVYQLLELSAHLWDSVYPFDLDSFMRNANREEDFKVLYETTRLKYELSLAIDWIDDYV